MLENGKKVEISIDFKQAVIDYLYLLEKLYPHKAILKIIGDRYRLSKTQRSILFRGITRKEAASYARFVGNYNQYFTQFFDPIGFVFVTEPSFNCRLLIMPLVEKGIYSELQKNLKTEPMNPGPRLKNGILKVGTNLKIDRMRSSQ